MIQTKIMLKIQFNFWHSTLDLFAWWIKKKPKSQFFKSYIHKSIVPCDYHALLNPYVLDIENSGL